MNFAATFVWRGEAGQARFDGSCRRGEGRGEGPGIGRDAAVSFFSSVERGGDGKANWGFSSLLSKQHAAE